MPIKRFQILGCLPFCALLVAAAANLAQASALDSLGAGIAAYQRGEFDEAIRLLGDAISDGGLAPPELGQAYGKRGNTYYDRGMHRLAGDHADLLIGHRDIDQAIADFNAAIRLDPTDAQAYNDRGLAYWHKTPGYFREARSDFDTAIRLKPDFAKAYLNRGRLSWPESDQAIADFSEAIRLESDSPIGVDARLLRGDRLSTKREFDRAIADYDAILRFVPDHVQALSGRGSAHRHNREFSKAIADFSMLISVSVRSIAAFGAEDGGTGEGRKLSDAIGAYDHAIKNKDRCIASSGYRNSLPYYKWRELEVAISAFGGVINRQPSNYKAIIGRGIAHYHRGELDAAIDDFTTVVGVKPPARFAAGSTRSGSPDLPTAYWSRARAYSDKGDFDQAIADFDDAQKAWKASGRAAYPDVSIFDGRGIALLRKREFANAIADFNAVIHLQPDYSPPYAHRAIAKLYSGLSGAAEDLSNAVRLAPSNPYWVLWLHLARVRAGEDDRDELAANAAKLDRNAWPWPIVQMQLGNSRPISPPTESALAGDSELKRIWSCEASFYAGTFEAEKGASQRAKQLFQAAADGCRPDSLEAAAAKMELKRFSP
jgi:tetratricopeptide (TPR) repeat protein